MGMSGSVVLHNRSYYAARGVRFPMDQGSAAAPEFASLPRIVLGSDNHLLSSTMHQALHQAGFTVDLAYDYIHLENLWQQRHHEVVLVEVAYPHSVEPAIHTAQRIKQQDGRQFIAYLADAALHNELTGDAIFFRDARSLPGALRECLEASPR